MYKGTCKVVIAGLALMAVVMYLQAPTQALPMFARRFDGASCTKCHWYQNALNATGKAFLRHGMRDVGETVDVRDPEFSFSHYASLVLHPSLSAERNGRTAFSAGDAILWLGGPVSDDFSAISEIEFKVDEEEVEVEELYVQYVSNSGGEHTDEYASADEEGMGPDLLDLSYYSGRAGQFQPLLLLSNVSGPPRIPISRPEVLSGRATNGNGWRPRSRLRGVELGCISGPWSGYVAIGNGEGQNESDSHMDTYITAERQFGTQGSSLGVYGYWGEAVLAGSFRDSFNRYGVIGNFTAERTRVICGFVAGKNNNPAAAGDLDNDGWFVEVAQRITDDTAVAYFRWDDFNADLSGGGQRESHGPTLGVSWTPDADTGTIRLTLEGRWMDTDSSDEDSVIAQLQLAF